MKLNKTLAAAAALGCFLVSSTAMAAVTVKYSNKDSKNYTWNAKCSGSSYKVSFRSSTTGSSTIQGSGPCVVTTEKGKVTLKQGMKIEIKNGHIIIK